MILNMTGGGAGLNFSVKAYAELPETGKENEIAVITDTEMTGWVISPMEPTEPVEGLVWIAVGQTGPVSFNALKKQGIILYPLIAKQYISDAWVTKTAKSFQNSEWTAWITYIFGNGTVNEELTGGIYGVSLLADGSALLFNPTVTSGENKTYTTKNAINLTNFDTIRLKVKTTAYTGTTRYIRLAVIGSSKNGSYVITSGLLKYVSNSSWTEGEVVELDLDVSDITGEQFVGISSGVNSGDGSQRQTEYNIMEWTML